MAYRARVYPHNDLLNLAHYHREVIERKHNHGIKDAIALDCMSCVIALAFSVEAIVNFVGAKVITNWKERLSYQDKMATIGDALGLDLDFSMEPYKTLYLLKETRDQMAHGKPIESTAEASSREAMRRAMECPWDNLLTPKFTEHAYEQVKTFEHCVLSRAGISIAETLTSAVGVQKEI